MGAWLRGSDTRPLVARYEETARELIALGAQPETPMTEQAHFNNASVLERIRPQPAHDAALSAAGREFFDLQCRYRRAVLRIVALQARLKGSVNSWQHRLIGDVPSGWDTDLRREIPDTSDRCSAREVRAAIGKVMPSVLAVEALRDGLEAALNIDNIEPATLHHQMIGALFERSERQAAALHDAAAALSKRMDALEEVIGRIGKRVRSRRRQGDV
jgi:hypothetical protein